MGVRRTLLFIALTGACLAAAVPAQAAAPRILSAEAEPGALLDQVTTILVEARSDSAAVNGVLVREAGVPGGFAETACRSPRKLGGVPAPSGPLRAGREVAFEVPYLPRTAGVHVLEVTVFAGDCGPKTEKATTKVTVDVTLPQTPALPGTGGSGGTGGTGGGTGLPLPGIGLPPIARSAQGCGGADLEPSAANLAALRLATVCLINVERAKAGIKLLSGNVRLRRAATAHASDMIARKFFAHDAPSPGPDLARRVKKVRYWPAIATENIGTASGALATPRVMVDAWMNSDGHRHNILDPAVRQIGVWIAFGMYTGTQPGATYVANFGCRC